MFVVVGFHGFLLFIFVLSNGQVNDSDFRISNYKRWKKRICSGIEPVKKPGAKKVAPIDLTKLHQQIAQLEHGKKRTPGIGRLYQANKDRI